jgi:hypothetical protein
MKCSVCKANLRDGCCPYLCHVTVPGWLEWNARTGKMIVKRAALLPYLRNYISYPRLVALCACLARG